MEIIDNYFKLSTLANYMNFMESTFLFTLNPVYYKNDTLDKIIEARKQYKNRFGRFSYNELMNPSPEFIFQHTKERHPSNEFDIAKNAIYNYRHSSNSPTFKFIYHDYIETLTEISLKSHHDVREEIMANTTVKIGKYKQKPTIGRYSKVRQYMKSNRLLKRGVL